MAQRQILTVPVAKFEREYEGCYSGSFVVERRGLLLDSTVGPIVSVEFENDKEAGDRALVSIKVLALESLRGGARLIYHRSLQRHQARGIYPIFGRYHNPFEEYETKLDPRDPAAVPPPYHWNPRLEPSPGDHVKIQVLSPWPIKKIDATLEFVELRGHVTPEKIEVRGWWGEPKAKG